MHQNTSSDLPDIHVKQPQRLTLTRNQIVKDLRSSRRAYFQGLKPSNHKKFWKAVKCLNRNPSSIPVLTHNNTTYDTDRDKADALNSFLNSCFNNIVTPLQETLGDATMPNDISDLLCTEEEVAGFLRSLDATKANGNDGISARMLKSTATAIAPSITKLFNQSI